MSKFVIRLRKLKSVLCDVCVHVYTHQPDKLLHSIKSILCYEEEGPVSYVHV